MKQTCAALALCCLFTAPTAANEKTLSLRYIEGCAQNVEHYDIVRGDSRPTFHAPHDNPNAFCYCVWRHIRPEFNDDDIAFLITRDQAYKSPKAKEHSQQLARNHSPEWQEAIAKKLMLMDETVVRYCDQTTRHRLPAKPQKRFFP